MKSFKNSSANSGTQENNKKSAVTSNSFKQKCGKFVKNTKKVFAYLVKQSVPMLTYGFYIAVGYSLFKIKSNIQQKTGVSTYEMLKMAESGKEMLQLANSRVQKHFLDESEDELRKDANGLVENLTPDYSNEKRIEKIMSDNQNYYSYPAKSQVEEKIEEQESSAAKEKIDVIDQNLQSSKFGERMGHGDKFNADDKKEQEGGVQVEGLLENQKTNVPLENRASTQLKEYIKTEIIINENIKKYIRVEIEKQYRDALKAYISNEISSYCASAINKDLVESLIKEGVKEHFEENKHSVLGEGALYV